MPSKNSKIISVRVPERVNFECSMGKYLSQKRDPNIIIIIFLFQSIRPTNKKLILSPKHLKNNSAPLISFIISGNPI